ncbi:hypothetical protein Tco_1501831 [Tanacetum coccineum]
MITIPHNEKAQLSLLAKEKFLKEDMQSLWKYQENFYQILKDQEWKSIVELLAEERNSKANSALNEAEELRESEARAQIQKIIIDDDDNDLGFYAWNDKFIPGIFVDNVGLTIKNRVFNVGDQVLLFNSRLKIFSGKLKSRWSGPFTIANVYPYGTIELSQKDGPNFKVNGHRVKHYFGEDVPNVIIPDVKTDPP